MIDVEPKQEIKPLHVELAESGLLAIATMNAEKIAASQERARHWAILRTIFSQEKIEIASATLPIGQRFNPELVIQRIGMLDEMVRTGLL